MKKHIITISGKLGSGKSSTAKGVAEKLGYDHKSTGDFFRMIAKKRGITLEELGNIAENDQSIDREIDDMTLGLKEETDIVIDSRLAYHWIPGAFKVFLDLDPETSATRIMQSIKNKDNQTREVEELHESIEEMKQKIEKRYDSEKKRFKDIYGIEDFMDPNLFDLVIDTKQNNLEQVIDIVLTNYNEWLNQ